MAPGLKVEAVAEDGLVEAASLEDGWCLAVQWHPEWRPAEDPISVKLFKAFGDALTADIFPMPSPRPDDYSNVEELGMLLYTDYFYAFEIAALILMVAMISAISLAFRGKRQGTKTQEVSQQVKVKKADRIRIVKMDAEKPEQGEGA